MGTGSHNPDVNVDVSISTLPPSITAFSVALLLVPLASNSLNGSRVMTFGSLVDAQEAADAGYISAATMAAATAAFSQPKKPSAFKVGYVNLVGYETYATALAACVSADANFYWTQITPRTDAEIVAVSDYIEGIASSRPLRFMFQSDDTGLLGSFPSGLSGAQGNQRTGGVYHSSDSQWNDVAYVVNRATFDPEVRRVPWVATPIAGVEALSPRPTQAQRNAAADTNYINLMLPYGAYPYTMSPGVMITGRPIEEGCTADYLQIKLQSAVATMVAGRAVDGLEVAVDATGQALILAQIVSVFQAAETARHIEPGWTAVAETISTADRTARRMRFTVRATLVVSGRLFAFNVYLDR